MGSRVKLSSLASADVEDVPGRATATPARLRLPQLAPTPINPRKDCGDADHLTELGESMRIRQLQPVVAVARAPYLALWPDHEDQLHSADYVLVNGERRYRAALHVGLETLDALINEQVADTTADFLDALLSENIDRRNFDPIEEALAIEAMVAECGSATEAARRFRRHKAWVSQRRALLKLTPEIQERVRSGEISVRAARTLVALPQDAQEAAWLNGWAEQPRGEQQSSRQEDVAESSEKATSEPGVYRGKHPQAEFPAAEWGPPDPGSGEPSAGRPDQKFTAVNTSSDGQPSRPEPTAAPAATGTGLPWESPHELADIISGHMGPGDLATLIALLEERHAGGAP